ncbi:MAG: DinB family protein [Thermomicrobiales bacterium]
MQQDQRDQQEQQPSAPRHKADLLDRIERAWAELERAIDRFSEAQLTGRTDAVGWTAKDHLSHLTTWEASMIAILQRRARHLSLGVDESTYLDGTEDEINAAIQARTKDRTLAEVVAERRAVHEELLATLAGLSDGDLRLTYSDYLPDEPGEESGIPMLWRLDGNTASHYDEHRPWIEAIATE